MCSSWSPETIGNGIQVECCQQVLLETTLNSYFLFLPTLTKNSQGQPKRLLAVCLHVINNLNRTTHSFSLGISILSYKKFWFTFIYIASLQCLQSITILIFIFVTFCFGICLKNSVLNKGLGGATVVNLISQIITQEFSL